MDFVEFIEDVYGIELLRRYANLPKGSRIVIGRDGLYY